VTAPVLLAGNPNSGKTTLFNALTGARARTGNYPGVTVERRSGKAKLPSGAPIEIVDLPGTYSLSARSAEEQVAVDAVLPSKGPLPSAVVVVVDATTLARHLYLALAILETGIPCVVALNMMDEARSAGVSIEHDALAKQLGAKVVPIVARTGEGVPALLAAIEEAITPGRVSAVLPLPLPGPAELHVRAIEAAVRDAFGAAARSDAWVRARALWALLSIGDDELVVPPSLRDAVTKVAAADPAIDVAIIGARYARIDEIVEGSVRAAPRTTKTRTDRIDAWLTHPVYGSLTFAVVMIALFQALFTWSEPLVSVIEWLVARGQDTARAILPAGPLADLVAEGVIAGVGNVVTFVPQIALLSLFLVILEDCGYLARVAFVIDRVMRGVGLHGRAFVPLLSGFACAVPAVLATRTIESRRDRLVTMLALPLMSCSARLPVYTLVIAVAFPGDRRVLGVLSVGAIALFGMYALSVVTTLSAAAVLRRTVLRGKTPALLLELPPYRMPVGRNVLLAIGQRTTAFITNAGTVILAITIVLWALLAFPRDGAIDARFDEQVAAVDSSLEPEAHEARVAAIEGHRSEEQLRVSIAGRLGHAFEPVIAPLGYDWRIGVGLIASFAAREVLVSTLGLVYGLGDSTDESSTPLRDELRRARRPDGSLVFTPLTGLSLMIFFVLAAQCMSTLAVVRRESGSWGWALFMLVYMNVLAYGAAFLVYQGGRLLGFA
jgi:ferrous iron transport protein B